MLVEELVDNGMATLKEEMLSIGLDDFYALEAGARAWLVAEEVVQGEIHIRVDGALGREDALWEFDLLAEGQVFTQASINSPFVEVGGASRMLDRDQARATALVFDAQENPSMSNQYKVLEALQGLDCVVMSGSLKAMKAHHVTQLSVEAVEE